MKVAIDAKTTAEIVAVKAGRSWRILVERGIAALATGGVIGCALFRPPCPSGYVVCALWFMALLSIARAERSRLRCEALVREFDEVVRRLQEGRPGK